MRRIWAKLWPVLKVLVPAAIILGVGWHFWNILSRRELAETAFDVRPLWLLGSGLLYLAAHMIWASFWTDLLRAQHVDVSRGLGVRSYFVSQFGKYVPGKAWVILLRVAVLRHHTPNRGAVVLAAFYETLTAMAAGALVGVLLLPWLGERAELVRGGEWALLLLVGLPMAIGVVQRLLGRRKRADPGNQRSRFRLVLLLRGLLQDSVGWALLGLGLWMCVRGLAAGELPLDVAGFLRFTAMTAVAYVAGFAALLAPGGAGVREWLLQAFLTAELAVMMPDGQAAALAVVVALVLRLVWTVAELFLIGALYLPNVLARARTSPRPTKPPVSESR